MNPDVKKIVDMFREINSIPRCSSNEEHLANWLVAWGEKHGFKSKRDAYNNVVITVPPSKGYENKPSIAIQGHMDMVCEKTEDSQHDFSKDPVDVIEKDGWLIANGTTLGADDGIALAIGMVLSQTDKHPELELLFTSSEEIGLVGAMHMDKDFFKSKILINVDSEREGEITIGCAGGEDTHIEYHVTRTNLAGFKSYSLSISGLRSGHSGTMINSHRANAIKLGARILNSIRESCGLRLIHINGGSARNAIPSTFKADFAVEKSKSNTINEILENFINTIIKEYPNENPIISILPSTSSEPTISEEESEKTVDLLHGLPHGVYEMSTSGEVETSNNLARVYDEDDTVHIFTNQRSLLDSKLREITQSIHSIVHLAGCSATDSNRYPAWQPNQNSELLKKSREIYRKLFGKDPVVKTVHAGLECGVIASKRDDVDMISIGPTIENPHSPQERLDIKSLEKIWIFINEIIKTI